MNIELATNLKDLDKETKKAVKDFCKGLPIDQIYVFWDCGNGDFEGGATGRYNYPTESGFRSEFIYSPQYYKFYTIKGYKTIMSR